MVVVLLLLMPLTKLAATEQSSDKGTRAPSNCSEALLSVLMPVINESEAHMLTELYSVSGHGLLKLTGMNSSKPLTLVNWPWNATDRSDEDNTRLLIDHYEVYWPPGIITIKAQWSTLNKYRYLSIKENDNGKPILSLQALPSARAHWKWEPLNISGDPFNGRIAIQRQIKRKNGTAINQTYYLGVKKDGTVFLHQRVVCPNRSLSRRCDYKCDPNQFLFRRCNYEYITISNLGNFTYNTCWWTGPEATFSNIVKHCLRNETSKDG